jgi:hypothetical protein
MDATLQAIQENIFSKEGTMEVVPICSAHREAMTIHELQECYNVAKKEQDEEDPGM